MRRKLFYLVGMVSLALWLATVALWVRSYYAQDSIKWRKPDREILLASSQGEIGLRLIVPRQHQSSWSPKLSYHRIEPRLLLEPSGQTRRFLGFISYQPYSDSVFSSVNRIVIPCWSAVMLICVAPMLWTGLFLKLKRRQRRLAEGLCVNCGYDLRASPELCPECGAVPAPTK